MLFAKNTGKNLRGKYSQNILDQDKQSATDALKTASKKAIQKKAKGNSDFIGNEISGKIVGPKLRSNPEAFSQAEKKNSRNTKMKIYIPRKKITNA